MESVKLDMKNNIQVDIKLTGAPNGAYEKFFDKFKEIDNLKIADWNVTQILGYFCKKYQATYNTNYQFKFNSPSPIKSFEVFQIKKLAMLLSSSPEILKEYIDWVYENKVAKAKRKLTSISFLTQEGTVNEYKFNVLLSGKRDLNISRATALPEKYKTVFEQANIKVNTYGDLAFISQISDMPTELINAFQTIEAMGFDTNILKRIV
jgi:hypothetical protein